MVVGRNPPRMHGVRCALALAALLLAVPRARAGEVLARITLDENRGAYRAVHVVTSGVPLPRGRVLDPAALAVVDEASGVRLPAQWRTLCRWPDGSVRWALLDARTPLDADETVTLAIGPSPRSPDALADADPSPGADPFALVTDDDGTLWIDDGTTRWPLLRRTPDGDEIAGLRARLVDRFGHAYHAVVDGVGATELERGPVRATFVLRGRHEAVAEPEAAPAPGDEPIESRPLPVPFHTFTAWVHVLAGTSTARVEWALENGDLLAPTGRLGFRSYTLRLAPPPGAPGIHVPGSNERRDQPFALRQFAAERSTWSWSVGERTWVPRDDGDLWAALLGDGIGHYAHVQDSAPGHPTALLHEPGAPLEIALLAEGAGEEFFLDDATRKTFRLTLARDVGRAGRALVQAAADPIEPRLDPALVAASGAWGDAGAFFVPAPRAMKDIPLAMPRTAPTGWADWGEVHSKSTRASGSARNRLSVYLEAVQSGRNDARRAARARAHHAMDLRPFHIQGFVAEEHPDVQLYEGVPHPNDPPEHSLGRKSIDPALEPWRRRLPPNGHGYNGIDPEHLTLDDVYEHWLLTGSWPAHDALRAAGEALLTWDNVRPGPPLWSSRTTGWTLRALVQVHRATGEPRFLDAAARIVDKVEQERGRGDVRYLHRQAPDPRHVADADWDSPWMVAVAIHGLVAYHAESGDARVPAILEDLVAFVMSAWTGQGFLDSIPLDRPPPQGALDPQPAGTSQWIPGALASAASVTGDHRPVDTVLPLYVALREGHASFGRATWHWWQPYLVDLAARHGASAVANPSTLAPSGGR